MSTYPGTVDKFWQVTDEGVVLSRHINALTDPIPAIEQSASKVILTDQHAETDWAGSVRRREIVMDSCAADSKRTANYCDQDVTLMDSLGKSITNAWTSQDYAIAVKVTNTTSVPAPGVSTVTAGRPYRWSIIGYKNNNATATIRLFNRVALSLNRPYLIKPNPTGTFIYALCGTTVENMSMSKWDATSKEYLGKVNMENPGGQYTLLDNIRDFCISTDSTGATCYYLLERSLTYGGMGFVRKYSTAGKLVSRNAVQTYINLGEMHHNVITSDPSGNIYIGGYNLNATYDDGGDTGGADCKSAIIMKYDSAGKYTGTSYSETYGKGDAGDGFGDHFTYSWIYGLTYADGSIYAAIHNQHHQLEAITTQNPHPVIRKLSTGLVKADVMQITGRDMGQIAVYTNLSGHTVVAMTNYWASNDYLWARTTLPAARAGVEEFSGTDVSVRIFDFTAKTETPMDVTKIIHPSFSNIADTGHPGHYKPNCTPIGIAANPTLKEFYYTAIGDAVDTYNRIYTRGGIDSGLSAEGPRIKAQIDTTLVTCVDPSIHLRPKGTGNMAANPNFTDAPAATMSEHISPTIVAQRQASLLRDKPAPTWSSLTGGWGAISVDPAVWQDTGEMETMVNTSFMHTEEIVDGVRVISTSAAAVTKNQLGFVTDPSANRCLYMPAVWLGKYDATESAHSVVERICSPDVGPDSIPTFTTSTTKVLGKMNVPILDTKFVRPYSVGETVTLKAKFSAHMLYKLQNSTLPLYMRVYLFVQTLDASGVPLRPLNPSNGAPAAYEDGSALYHLDFIPVSINNNKNQYAEAVCIQPGKANTHKYRATPWISWAQTISCPENTESIRMGFAVGITHDDRKDNLLTDTGESGGLYVDDISVEITPAP